MMLINLIGCDGCGKSTQLALVTSWLGELGQPVRVVSKRDIFDKARFPECQFFGCSYRELMYEKLPLMRGESRALFLLYMFSVVMCRYPVGPGEVVIADGYWHKHIATERAFGLDAIWLDQVGSFLPNPDVTLFLDLRPDVIVVRRREAGYGSHAPYECGCDLGCSDAAFVEHMDKVYVHLKAMAHERRWATINARETKDAVFSQIKAALTPHLIRASVLTA